MDEFGVSADRNDVRTHVFKRLLPLCQSGEFSRSDKGKIGGLEEKDRPSFCSLLPFEAEFAKITLCRLVRFKFEIRCFLPYAQTTACTRHKIASFSWLVRYR